MKTFSLGITAFALATALGCTPQTDPNESANPGQAPAGQKPLMPAEQQDKGNRFVLLVCVRLMTISMPVGTVSGSETLWSYLDEERVEAIRSASLGLNGLRVGVTDQEGWKDLVKLLQEMTGQPLKMTTMICRPGQPLFITLKQHQPAQTVFTYSDDRSLAGTDYPPGDNLLTLDCTLNEDDPSKVMITGMPQIRTTAHRPQFVAGPGLPAMVSKPDFFSFEAATFRVTLPSEAVLVVGAGSESRRRSSIGHALLVDQQDGVERETLIVLIPEVFATPLR